MIRIYLAFIAILFLLIIPSTKKSMKVTEPYSGKLPTEVTNREKDEEEFEQQREQYFDLIHGHHPNWKEINRKNLLDKYLERSNSRHSRTVETFAGGEFEAEWQERGSSNQAGNVRITEYHKATGDVYAVSDGGFIWKGTTTGLTWTPLNEDLTFDREVLKVVDLPSGGVRIIASIGAGLWYSDDNGANWMASTGFDPFPNGGRGIDLVQLNDASNTLVYLCLRKIGPGSWINSILYSVDNGANFTFVQNLSTSDDAQASMAWTDGADHSYILDSDEDLYLFSGTSLTSLSASLSIGGTSTMQLEVNEAGSTVFYALMDQTDLYKSTDGGSSFSLVSILPTNTWDCGFALSIDDPDILYYGEMELWRSFDGGVTWTKVSDWWEYYDDVPNKIHADIMSMTPFKKTDGTEFTLISDHGGINISFDNLLTTPNIGLADLNVGQFYDVLTSPINSNFLFGGTQDQGFLRTADASATVASAFEQVISGDYGQMQLSDNGATIWTQYPGGQFAVYNNAMTDADATLWYDVSGSDMPNVNWIIPSAPAPNSSDKYILVGGGELYGSSGSHVLKLEYNSGVVTDSQFDHDFKASSGQPISAIETTSLQPDFIYVSTANGHFYLSDDAGTSFTETTSFVGPTSSWIYGADIYASKITPGLVFFAGSGYGLSSSVYVSVDSGQTFTPVGTGLPETLTHELCMDPAEKYLFAATDAGPYVYSMESEQWYDLLGLSAPVQEYITVEFVETDYLVRFGTWGRGIWDLKLQTTTHVKEIQKTSETMWIYPNPAANFVKVDVDEPGILQLVNFNGQVVFESGLTSGSNTINISSVAAGTYVARMGDVNGRVRLQKLLIR